VGGSSAIPERRHQHQFLTQHGFFWSCTEAGPTTAYDMKLDYSSAAAALLTDLKAKGFSVRCLRNY
jgi:uncharacterized protein (TIGR02145 family)